MRVILLTITLLLLFNSNEHVKACDYKTHTELVNNVVMSDIVEWKYRIIDGKTYRRLYNLTHKRWESQWILVN